MVLRHDDVMGRQETRVQASITQIDLHDFCRLARSYGIAGVHCVSGLDSQHTITETILDYWNNGPGCKYNPDRTEAISLLHLHRCQSDLDQWVRDHYQQEALYVGTSARHFPQKTLEFSVFWDTITLLGRPAFIQFGTSWGLSPEHLSRCDWVLPPIDGHNGYNHLSVRCAAAILIDRVMSASILGS